MGSIPHPRYPEFSADYPAHMAPSVQQGYDLLGEVQATEALRLKAQAEVDYDTFLTTTEILHDLYREYPQLDPTVRPLNTL